MDIEKIKKLREKLALPLTQARQLLQQNQGDIEQSIHAYHHQNIAQICQETDCDESLAKQTYWRYFNPKKTDNSHCIAKAIKTINDSVTVISSQPSYSKIGFCIWGETQAGEVYQPFITRKHLIFVSSDDFDIILPYFKQVFPVKTPYGIEDSFDYCGNNWFENVVFWQIISDIKANKHHICQSNTDYQNFLLRFVSWCDGLLSYAEVVVVAGNQ